MFDRRLYAFRIVSSGAVRKRSASSLQVEPGLCGVLYLDEPALCVGLGLDSDTWNFLDVGINSWNDCMSQHLSLLAEARNKQTFSRFV